jgi:hypothetical protein
MQVGAMLLLRVCLVFWIGLFTLAKVVDYKLLYASCERGYLNRGISLICQALERIFIGLITD